MQKPELLRPNSLHGPNSLRPRDPQHPLDLLDSMLAGLKESQVDRTIQDGDPSAPEITSRRLVETTSSQKIRSHAACSP